MYLEEKQLYLNANHRKNNLNYANAEISYEDSSKSQPINDDVQDSENDDSNNKLNQNDEKNKSEDVEHCAHLGYN